MGWMVSRWMFDDNKVGIHLHVDGGLSLSSGVIWAEYGLLSVIVPSQKYQLKV